jgi:hypothetical protein
MNETYPLTDRCLAVESTRCSGIPTAGQVLCLKHQKMRDIGANFSIAIIPLDQFRNFQEKLH